MKRIISTAIVSLLVLSACGKQTTVEHTTKEPEVNTNALKAHIEFLADDLLKGRDTGSEGYEIAARYMASQFKQFGVKPIGDEDSYLQQVKFRQAHLDQNSPEFKIEGGEELKYPKDFIMSASAGEAESFVSGETVFVGYGIVAPTQNHDDYAGLDVSGKIVVMLPGKPERFPSEEGAHLASSREKAKYADERGAIGTIVLTTPKEEERFSYTRKMSYIHTPSVRWLDENGQPNAYRPNLKGSALLNLETSKKLFTNADKSLQEIFDELDENIDPKGFELNQTVTLSKKSRLAEITSPNVAGFIEGSDPELKQEYVLFTAHLDHIGLSKTVEGDRINNGAMDNATGSATLLETARMIAELEQKPKRSVLFLAVTGEEKGLLGADYYAHYPTVPKSQIVANVNLDMPILTYPFADIIAFGAEHSSLKAPVARAAENLGLKLSPDPMPEEHIFTRSDHYMFVKQGIPAVYVVPGWTSSDPQINGEETFNQFLKTDYHRPSDEVNDNLNWDAATMFADVNYQIGLSIANDPARPRWNEDNFFGDTFGTELTKGL